MVTGGRIRPCSVSQTADMSPASSPVPLSVLDLVPVSSEMDAPAALRATSIVLALSAALRRTTSRALARGATLRAAPTLRAR